MAKRKRLTPAPTRPPAAPAADPVGALPRGLGPARMPIAEVAQDASTSAALAEVAQTLTEARRDGRLIQRLPLAAIVEDHLVRDRIATDDAEMAALRDSLRERGQQTAIEVVALENGRYGLISGWRRVMALRALSEAGDGPDDVLAIVRTPADAAQSYVAMVEENEIRVGLSFYERARIVARAADEGVFAGDRAALGQLFAAVSRSKRSKIGSFVTVVRALDGALAHPTALTERAGLALAQALEADGDLAPRLRAALDAAPGRDAAEEARILETTRAPVQAPAPKAPATPAPPARTLRPGLEVRVENGGTLRLSGPALRDADFVARLMTALEGLE